MRCSCACLSQVRGSVAAWFILSTLRVLFLDHAALASGGTLRFELAIDSNTQVGAASALYRH
jgi:hypothetical protein